MSTEQLRTQDKIRYAVAVVAGSAIGFAGWQLVAEFEDNLVDEQALIEVVDTCADKLPAAYPIPMDQTKKPAQTSLPEACLFDEDYFSITPGRSSNYENVESPEEPTSYIALTSEQYKTAQYESIQHKADWARTVGKIGRTVAAVAGLVIGLGLAQGAYNKRQVD